MRLISGRVPRAPDDVPSHCPGCSWGTAVWPLKRPELVRYLIESLLEVDPPLPFLFATAANGAEVAEDLREKVKASGRGLIVPWAPQLTVLQHGSIRFFLVSAGTYGLFVC